MATYKVPQDVEADDKLIGPFSFRQFIYLIIVVLAGAMAWGLSQIFFGLIVIPLPIMVFFGALALPLRKDQPMEIYMAAMVSFYLKPRKRLWDPEGVETLIEVSAPKTVEVSRIKDLSQNEAAQRLSYLADIVDTKGWAIRGVSGATGTAINNDVYLEAQSAVDVLDTNTEAARNFDLKMSQSTDRLREEARQRMMQAAAPVTPVATTTTQTPTVGPQLEEADPMQAFMQSAAPQAVQVTQPQTQAPQTYEPLTQAVEQTFAPTPEPTLGYNQPVPKFDPYPSFRQSIVQPLGDTTHHAESDIPVEAPVSTSDLPPSADIMNLANNPDISIATIAHEANRIKKRAEKESEEVIISLR